MAPPECEACDNVALAYNSGPNSLTATWEHSGKDINGFTVRFFRRFPDPTGYQLFREVLVAKTTRKNVATQLHLAAGQTWRVSIYAECKNCKYSDTIASDDLLIT